MKSLKKNHSRNIDGQRSGNLSTHERLLKLDRKVQSLCQRMYALQQELEDLQVLFEELLENSAPELLAQRPARSRQSSNDQDARMLKQLANIGANIVITRASDGSATVKVGSSPVLYLTSPVLADLLEILCEDCGTRTDHLVGWKTVSDICDRLQAKTGQSHQPHAVTVGIWRLREAFKTCNINRFYIQTNRRNGGYRFARKLKDITENVGNLK